MPTGSWSYCLQLTIAAGNPLLQIAPKINAQFVMDLKILADTCNNISSGCIVAVNGTHDRFPAYELYINSSRVYSYCPIASGEKSPMSCRITHYEPPIPKLNGQISKNCYTT